MSIRTRYTSGRRHGPAGVVGLALALGACAGTRPVAEAPPVVAPRAVPAGVDSAVAAHADSVADASFVDVDRQEAAAERQEAGRAHLARSDSAWSALTARQDPAPVTSAADSARAQAAVTRGGEALLSLDRLLRDSDLDGETLARQVTVLLDSAQAALETAHELNPFDPRSKLWLARVYELQARRLGQAEAYQQAIIELEKLTRLTPDQHTVFALLANNYFYVQDWTRAAENYALAARVYEATYDLVPDGPVAPDAAQLFGYARAEADMHVRRLDAPQARAAFARALRYAPTADDTAYVTGELTWMAWDDGNIASSFARDSLMAIERAGDLAGARDGYLALLPRLSAGAAVTETEWRLAIVDYNLGNVEAAAERLQAVVRRTPVDSAGVPLDTASARYLDDYGTICLNIGRDVLQARRDNRTALKYFEQASRVRWSGQAAAFLEIATLVQGNTSLAIANASEALRREAHLATAERRSLYELLMALYRRTGDFEAARRYRDALHALEPQSP